MSPNAAFGRKMLVVGLGVTGTAVARRLGPDNTVVVIDDGPTEGSDALARSLGVTFAARPSMEDLASLVAQSEIVIVSPGVPLSHPVHRVADSAGVPVSSELELAWELGRAPIAAITGTNGKTTTTILVTRMLQRAGIRAIAAGNIGTPLIEAGEHPVDRVVLEASSFQLAFTRRFRPEVATVLNIAEDHQDWHPSMHHYAECKARIWVNQESSDVSVANVDDPVVRALAARSPGRVVTFGVGGDYRAEAGVLRAPDGEVIVELGAMPRRRRHDVANGLAASATAMACGATAEDCGRVLEEFEGVPHRLWLIGSAHGVDYYDDSKATTPAAAATAAVGFRSVVLIAGGINDKNLHLDPLCEVSQRLRAVVAIGAAAGEVVTALQDRCPVVIASSMEDAVTHAAALSRPGDAVLLSPGFTSRDWYGDPYRARARHFVEATRMLVPGFVAHRRQLAADVAGLE